MTSLEAKRAAEYATLELNGFPAWAARLAATWPTEVGEVLLGEVNAELNLTSRAKVARCRIWSQALWRYAELSAKGCLRNYARETQFGTKALADSNDSLPGSSAR